MYRVAKLKFPGMENAYVLISATKRSEDETFGDFRVTANMSFLYDNGEYAAEWEPQHGPIQVWHKAKEGDEGAKEHYYYAFTNSPPLSFSQLAVDDYRLPQAFCNGEYKYIFAVLKDWACDR